MNTEPHSDLTIISLGDQGDGVALHDGRTIFVPGALVGEVVRCKIVDGQGEIIKVLTASCERSRPSCPHYQQCGGCRMQHMAPNAYVKWKQDCLRNLFIQNDINAQNILPTLISKAGTRRRARFAAKRHQTAITIGFNGWHQHEVFDLKNCLLLDEQIVSLVQKIRPKLSCWLKKNGSSGDVQITLLPQGFDVLLIGGDNINTQAKKTLVDVAEEHDLAQLSWRKNDRRPTETVILRRSLFLKHEDISVPFPAGSFLQATPEGEKALINYACAKAKNAGKFLDLFSGLGGFGLALPTTTEVTCIDFDGPAIGSLARAAKKNKRLTVFERDLAREPMTATECDRFDVVLFDPPRSGAKAQAEQLAISRVETVIAISCNPTTFIRDAKILINGGYQLQEVQPVDQFLWSTHLEIAALFTKKKH